MGLLSRPHFSMPCVAVNDLQFDSAALSPSGVVVPTNGTLMAMVTCGSDDGNAWDNHNVRSSFKILLTFLAILMATLCAIPAFGQGQSVLLRSEA